MAVEVAMAAGAVDFMEAVVEASMVAVVDSTAASAELAEVGVVAAGAAAGVVGGAVGGAADGAVAGAAAGVTQVGDVAGVGVIPVGVGGLALVGVGVPIGEATRMDMGMDIPIIPTIRTTQTMG
jgi:hypothetical protein